MSIRFKFRSSVNFDSVDIDGRPSISVRELRFKIIRHKNLNICQDFDLVFSDAPSGKEYDDDNFQIPSGSSVIIKRVPARTAPSAMEPIDAVRSTVGKGSYPQIQVMDQMDECNVFEADVSPVPTAILTGSDLEVDKNKCGNGAKANITGLRSGRPKLESDDQPIPRGFHVSGNKGKAVEEQRVGKETVEERTKLEKLLDPNSTAVLDTGLPSELKCFLCNTYFKHAVMIPCCQHSFCEKCIRQELVEKTRCPKCFSNKCKVKDLLPNLSLRQAIEHFLESRMLMAGSENAFNKYVPDGESGIQGKDASCAVTVIQREPELPHSPSATGKGSNQVIAESFYGSIMRRNASFGPSELNFNNLAAGRQSAAPTKQKGVNLVHTLPQNHVFDEADSTHDRKRGWWVEGGDRNFQATGRHIKNQGYRTCYMCGSPDHLFRDCPASSGPHPMLQTGPGIVQGGVPGYASSYWNGAACAPVRPFPNIYCSPAMMTFNASLVPVSPYVVPPYAPPMYGGLPNSGGIMRAGTMAHPIGNRAEHHLGHSDYMELRYSESKRKFSNENWGRGQDFDVDEKSHERYGCREPERSHDYSIRKEREVSESHSDDSFARRSRKRKKQGDLGDSDTYSADGRHEKSSRSSVAVRDQKLYSSERSSQVIEHLHTSSSKHSEDKYKPHKRSSRKHHERREQSHSDPSWGHRHVSGKADDVRRRVDSHVRDSHKKHDNHSEFGLEPISPGDQRRSCKDRDSGLESRHPRHKMKLKNEDLYDDRWQMVSDLDEDRRDDYCRHKRKRIH
ncbi:E3 ubiquitin ligase PARAQUAT TOLERANCE 3-like [Coffea eugenioides]|uniref:E3 ubiquitin ligase PARAQUAT TOLERANCE 3-like n=1 Tax=Coffea eugenioides TaxID=49369 RepID=UPI000F610D15|nr:E3 ubiquitin ligase PARAQUAT TOLERANCE 3-like [Coffea eugenioides]XP_027180501.1 E3 ubiquitin ligase PARAQUAT TOLERANCE 3-like [Coffea eugenioides]XP_027180516.1 E3 ubiquitin ligase PARAQUAT TOLERANCE 3-like [Coffea eugenioides]XP_027180517.1 E3 ubiquitin ligase PARAQUAT TOLERANCE 3-like [Coffea eugenioides]